MPRLSMQGLQVLKAFRGSAIPLAGADIMRQSGVASGTLYPLLARYEASKILQSKWEADRPEDMGRPRRKLYQLTKMGQEFAAKALREVAK